MSWRCAPIRCVGRFVAAGLLCSASGCTTSDEGDALGLETTPTTSSDVAPPTSPSGSAAPGAEPEPQSPDLGSQGGPEPMDAAEPDAAEPDVAVEPEPATAASPSAPTEPPAPALEPEASSAPEPGSAPAPDAGTMSPGSEPDAAVPGIDAGEGTLPTEPEPPLTGLLWPIDCVPGESCLQFGYPDVDGDGLAFDCSAPGYQGHEGTDIPITWEQMDAGVDVYAAADGEVLWVFDGKFDRCPDDNEPDCQEPQSAEPGSEDGVQVCTELGPYCNEGGGQCFWCFWGGNVVVIRHSGTEGVFATRYDHLKRGSIAVARGDTVRAGQKLAEVGSAGNSTGPHLHFEVWSTGYYVLTEPWVGECGPNTTESLWAFEPPWEEGAR